MGYLILRATSLGLLDSGLLGLPRSPQLPVELGALSPAGSRAALSAGFVAFALLDGHSVKDSGIKVLGVKLGVSGLGAT